MKTLATFTSTLVGSAFGTLVPILVPGRETYVIGLLVFSLLFLWGAYFLRFAITIFSNAKQAQADAQEVELKRLSVPPRGAELHHTGKPYDQLTDAEWNHGADENGYLSR